MFWDEHFHSINPLMVERKLEVVEKYAGGGPCVE